MEKLGKLYLSSKQKGIHSVKPKLGKFELSINLVYEINMNLLGIFLEFYFIIFKKLLNFAQHISYKTSTLDSYKNLVMSTDDCTSLVGNLGSTNDAISFGPRFLNKLL